MDDYFTRCRLAAFDPRALEALNRQESEYLEIAAKDLTVTASEVSGFPLSRIEAGKPLSLTEGLNPAWGDAISRFRDEVARPPSWRYIHSHRKAMVGNQGYIARV
jgi:hypothetical protein